MSELLSSIRPPEEQAVAPGYQIESQSDSYTVQMKATASGSVSSRSAKQSRCSFCRADLDERLGLTIPGSGKHGHRATTGCFCSTRCRNCVLALAALHPSPLASEAFISTRALLTDRLLDLWRQGQGPDPGLVLQAAKIASCGFPIADSAVLTGAHGGAQSLPLAKSPAIRPIKPSSVAVLETVECAGVSWVRFPPSPPGVQVESVLTSGDEADALAIQGMPRLLSEPA